MKKRLSILLTCMLFFSLLPTAFAGSVSEELPDDSNFKQFVNPTIQYLTGMGYSEEEAYNAFAVFCLANPENRFVEAIIVRYRNCGDWDEVFRFYHVDRDAVEKHIKDQKYALETSKIPYDIYQEMVEAGMTDEECQQFAWDVTVVHYSYEDINLETAWEAQKKGKTPADLLRERDAIENARANLVGKVATRQITVKECIETMKKDNPDMTMGEIIEFVNSKLKFNEELMIAVAELTDEERSQAEDIGMTNIFDVCYLKQSCRIFGFSYTELLEEIKNGTDVDTAVHRRVTPELVAEIKQNAGVDDRLETLE